MGIKLGCCKLINPPANVFMESDENVAIMIDTPTLNLSAQGTIYPMFQTGFSLAFLASTHGPC